MVEPIGYLVPRRPAGANIALLNIRNGRFVAAEIGFSGAWYGMLRAQRTTAPLGGWERFRLDGDCRPASGCGIWSYVAGRYVSAELNYSAPNTGMLRARSLTSGSPSWERFRFEGDCASDCAIRSVWSGLYVAAELNYTGNAYGMLRAARTTAPFVGWERFQIR